MDKNNLLKTRIILAVAMVIPGMIAYCIRSHIEYCIFGCDASLLKLLGISHLYKIGLFVLLAAGAVYLAIWCIRRYLRKNDRRQ